jgi:internalin A
MSEDKIREAIEAQITKLRLDGNQIAELTPLAGLTKLEILYLRENKITDLTPLAAVTELGRLNLRENQITDLSPLAELSELKKLHLHGNPIPDDQQEMIKKVLPNSTIYF